MPLEGFRFTTWQEVVLRDLDAFGHVNNAVYLTYIENGRVAYLRDVVGAVRVEQIRNVMATVTVDFRGEATYGDRLEIGVRTEAIGNRSFKLAYRLAREGGDIVAEATSVQVMYDTEAGVSIPVSPQWRAAIERFEEGEEHA